MLKVSRILVNLIFYAILALAFITAISGTIAFILAPVILGFDFVFVFPIKVYIDKRYHERVYGNVLKANMPPGSFKVTKQPNKTPPFKLAVLCALVLITASTWAFIVFGLQGLDRGSAFPFALILSAVTLVYNIYFALTE